jgi:putative acetyltransferase
MRIREIQFGDNSQLEALIKTTFLELELPLTGTVYEDVETTQMFESYQDDAAIYVVVEDHGLVKGGAGIKALAGEETSVCELQKMYLAADIRGKGYGKKLMKVCLEAAKSMGYKQCYLETLSELKAAQELYKRYGFEYLNTAIGNTGHSSCGIRMIKTL